MIKGRRDWNTHSHTANSQTHTHTQIIQHKPLKVSPVCCSRLLEDPCVVLFCGVYWAMSSSKTNQSIDLLCHISASIRVRPTQVTNLIIPNHNTRKSFHGKMKTQSVWSNRSADWCVLLPLPLDPPMSLSSVTLLPEVACNWTPLIFKVSIEVKCLPASSLMSSETSLIGRKSARHNLWHHFLSR